MFIFNKNLKYFSFKTFKNVKAWYLKNDRFNRLSMGVLKKFGRGRNGRVHVHSKGSVKFKKIFNILMSTYKGLMLLSCLVRIKFDISRTGIIGLFVNSAGCWFKSLLPSDFFLFEYIQIYYNGLDKRVDNVSDVWPRFLFDMKPHSRICFIEIITHFKISLGIKFIKSAGSRGLLLDNKYHGNSSIIVLPSLKVKIINSNSIAFLNFIENGLNKYLRPQKAGFYVNRGNKPTVRGVAKNPCDHPNGGRTKTVLLSRTPWGKVAKKSRKPSIIVNLKVLSKRLIKSNVDDSTSSLDKLTNIFNSYKSINSISKNVIEALSIKN